MIFISLLRKTCDSQNAVFILDMHRTAITIFASINRSSVIKFTHA